MKRILQQAVPAFSLSSSQSAPMRRHWFLLARIFWVVVTFISVVHLLASIPQLSTAVIDPALANHSSSLLTGYFIGLDILVSVIYLSIGSLIFWRSSHDPMALYTAIFLIAFGGTAYEKSDVFIGSFLIWHYAIIVLALLGQLCFLLFFYVFPDGHFIPRWTRFLAVLFTILVSYLYLFPGTPLYWWFASSILLWAASFILPGIFAQIYRYLRISNAVQRQQTKLVMFGLILAVVVYLLYEGIRFVLFNLGIHDFLFIVIGQTVTAICIICLPLAIGVAILRYRLWEIDLLINRTLVYGVLTACVIAIYVLVVAALAALLQASNNIIVSLIATGFVAVLVQPLRNYVQRNVNRLMYGERDDPYTLLSRLGQRLEGTLAPDAMLSTIVETVAQALKLPYAAIHMKRAGTFVLAASYGVIQTGTEGKLLRLSMFTQNEEVGEMVLALRASDESFTDTDQKLLRELTHQAALAVHAAQLTADLQQVNSDLQHSRERLVEAREEERRRIRRDLHDGLAPTLAALALTASTVGDLIPLHPAAATELANELQKEIRTTIGDIRRLVYALRPPALDQLGLAAALRDYIAQQTRSAAADRPLLQVTIDLPEPLPAFSAAVEVATYRIVQEAFMNVIRHAHASTCLIRLSLSDVLQIEVIDDGLGIPTEQHSGVGLLSMYERASELGGSWVIEKNVGVGTRICACLPLLKDQAKE